MRKLLALAFGLLLLSGPPAMWSAEFLTGLIFQPPLVNPFAIDVALLDWSTDVTSGTITRADVNDLTLILASGGSPVYTDVVLVGGVLQPIGGVARILDDIVFDFDLNTLTLSQIRNATPAQLAGSTGAQFSVEDNGTLPVDSQLGLSLFLDGVGVSDTIDLVALQQTTELVTPEPGTASVMVLALGSFALWQRARRQKR